MTAQLFKDPACRIVLMIKQDDRITEYVQHTGKRTELYRAETAKFANSFSPVESKKTPRQTAIDLLGGAKLGIIVTPAARFALEQVAVTLEHLEAEMPNIPTSVKPAAKKDAPKSTAPKAPAPKKPEAPVIAKNPDTKIKPETKDDLIKRIEKTYEEQWKQVEVEQEQSEPSDKNEREEKRSNNEAQRIVDDAREAANKMIEEARAMVEAAKQKFEEKRALDSAKAEAQKILDSAKKEVAKLKAEIAKLTGKRTTTRKAKGATSEEKPASSKREDISGMKIKVLVVPKMREDSARSAKINAILKCKTTDEALEYKGVNASFIRKLVEAGNIELV